MNAAHMAREFTRLKDLQRLLRFYERAYGTPYGTAGLRLDVIERMRKLAKLITYGTVLALLLFVVPAMAQPHHHPAEMFEGATGRFYETWMRPDQPMVSCCNRMDCAPVSHVRQTAGRWQARREADGIWLDIPPEKVEERRDSPDGRSHLCSIGSTVLCFIVGSGT